MLDFIHPGETLAVTRIDRLARSLRDLQTIVARLKEKGAHLAAIQTKLGAGLSPTEIAREMGIARDCL
ncbi:recombinase family protein [Roseovarius spongiae]|uniref:recombinase family protein n=1 Tax=Roseovarius spongiae TaxID=2320272 RepID=UPI003CCC663F